jgi:hypothetical protein
MKNLTFRVAALSIAVLVCVPIQSSFAQAASADPECIVDEVRKKYAERRGQIIIATDESVNQEDLDDTVDFEEKGCISSYGLDGSFSLASLAQGFLDGIRDAVCSAADNYLADQVDGLSASIDAPLGLAGVGGGLVRGGEGVNVEQRQNELDFDEEDWINDQFNDLPDVNPGYSDFNYGGGPEAGDENYINQDRTGTRR